MTNSNSNTSIERWKAIPEYPGYEVSDHGRVRSYKKPGPTIHYYTIPKYKKLILHKKNYIAVHFWVNRKTKTFLVHRLVLLSFVGPCPQGMEACHKDGNRSNNHLDNLRWDTHTNNQIDNLHNGTSKLTKEKIYEVRKLVACGFTYREIRDMTGVHNVQVSDIINKKIWKHV